jgi:hypothetical protein
MRKEAITDEFQLLLRHLYGLTEEYHEHVSHLVSVSAKIRNSIQRHYRLSRPAQWW